MSHARRRRLFLGVLVAMLALAVAGTVLALSGIGGWFLVGGPLSISVVALPPLVLTTDVGGRTQLTRRDLAPVAIGAVLGAAFLLLAGITDGSAETWFFVALMLVGLVLVCWGFWVQARRLLGRGGTPSTTADLRRPRADARPSRQPEP